MNKQKIASLAFAGLLGFNMNFGTTAKLATTEGTNVSTESRVETRADVKTSLKDRIEDSVRERVQNFLNKRGQIVSGKVTAKDDTSITVDNGGTSVKVNVSDKTQLRRKFWGKSTLAEISVGDSVNVIGRWANDTKTEMNAVLIRDLSIQKRFGVFFGDVKSLTSTGFVMTTIHRDDETVTIGSAKLVDRRGTTITQGDIQVGNKVRVRGMWDSNAKTITETVEVKDFSLPLQASPSPSPEE